MAFKYPCCVMTCLCGWLLLSGCVATKEPRSEPSISATELIPVGPFLEVDLDQKSVQLEAVTCLESGWLEQVVCGSGTREHESLLVSSAKGSDLHTALLLAGFQPGAPGRWLVDDDGSVITYAPTGDTLQVTLIWQDDQGVWRREPVDAWLSHGEGQPQQHEWVFAGSKLAPPPGQAQGIDVYYADASGSLVGLVTFGDEVVAHRSVMPDKVDVAAPVWSVNEEAVPAPGTPVKVLFRAAPTR